jgi:DNA-binding NarL/FixJ family response regulator
MKMRLAIVDDHDIVLQGLQLVLKHQPDIEVVGVASDAAGALECVRQTKPELILLDMEIPGSNGILLTRQILAMAPQTRIVIYSAYLTPEYVQEAIQAGVKGYLPKTHKIAEIREALLTAHSGQLYLCSEAATLLAQDYRRKADTTEARLSEREREVLRHIAEGVSTKEIAGLLSVSVKTVETHRQKIMEKLNLHSVAELTKYAIRQGFTRI